MLHKKVAVVIALVLCLGAGNAFAKMGKMGGGKMMKDCGDKCREEKGMMMKGDGMAHRFMKMVELLGLDPEQKKAVEAIHLQHRKEVIRKEADIDVAEIELKEIMGKEPLNMEEAENKIRAIASLHADLEIMHLKTKEAIKAKLTPEQLDKFKQHLASEMMERKGEMCGMGHMDCMCDEDCRMNGKMDGKMPRKMAAKMAGKMEARMEGRTQKCKMMDGQAGGTKESGVDMPNPAAMAEKMKAEHSLPR